MDNGYSDEEISSKIESRRKSLRRYLDRVNYYLPPSAKTSIFNQMERIKELVVGYVAENKNGESEGNDEEDSLDLSEFSRSYAELEGEISTVGPVTDGTEKSSVRESFKRFNTSTMYIEMQLKGANLSQWNEENGEDEGLDEEELMQILG